VAIGRGEEDRVVYASFWAASPRGNGGLLKDDVVSAFKEKRV
jgi:hypothetical protein